MNDRQAIRNAIYVAPAILGAVVIIGWWTGSSSITQLHPSFAAMQFNTALCFLLAGISFVLLSKKLFKSSKIMICALGVISLTTLAQYIFGTDLGIDLFFDNSSLLAKSQLPGRMSPTTASVFSLVSVSLAILTTDTLKKKIDQVVTLIGLLIVFVGFFCLFGYVIGQHVLDAWHSYIRVAVHTALGFCLVGTGLVFLSQTQSQSSFSIETFVGFGIACLSLASLIMGFIYFQGNNALYLNMERQNTFERLYGEIVYHDEALTMTAQMAAATNDRQWESRYNQSDEALTKSIDDLLAVFPELTPARLVNSANENLVRMERASFELVRQGHRAQALKVLLSDDYKDQKRIYKSEMENGKRILHVDLENKANNLQFRTVAIGSWALSLFTFSVIGWIFLFKRLNFLNQNFIQLNSSLESRVRTGTQLLVQQAKMASLGELSAGIAHEINNPLAIVEGSIGLLTQFVDNPEKFAKKIEVIQKATGRIAKIVRGLRKFSHSSDRNEYKDHSISLLIQEAIILTAMKARRSDVRVSADLKSDAAIFCDEVEIEQVVVNLINNAIDAAKMRSEKWVRLEVFNENAIVVLRVIDSGDGIPESIQSKIFDPFFTTKRVGEGTGLGLSISRGILEEHGAIISVVESLNTCFEIRFRKSEAFHVAA